MNFGEVYITFEKNKTNKSNEQVSRTMCFEHGVTPIYVFQQKLEKQTNML